MTMINLRRALLEKVGPHARTAGECEQRDEEASEEMLDIGECP